jgi:hypothetical protein
MPPRKLNKFMQALQNARQNNAKEFSYTTKDGEKKTYIQVKNSKSDLVIYKAKSNNTKK